MADPQGAAYWDGGYQQPAWAQAVPYGSEETYQIAADWLAGCRTVEDWGAGPAWMARFLPATVDYLPVDWAQSAIRPGWSQVLTADLARYESTRPDGIVIRHVLEHNDSWAAILANAVASFTRRMVLVTFIPLAQITQMLAPDSPGRDWAFAWGDLVALMDGCLVTDHEVASKTAYGSEHVWLLAREGYR